jgi:5S rRNA maturation endonuclease (ribonuclease M5)
MDADIKLGEITSWGPENLPAGPDVDSSSELIIVEGRADVLNLLRIGVKNTIAVQGTQVPKSILKLLETKKSVVAFLDGDRGGTIILNELLQVAKLDYIARAPEGLEVEELTRKQMIKSLQNKKPAGGKNIHDTKDKKEVTGKDALFQKLMKKLKVKNQAAIKENLEKIEPGHSIGFNKILEKLFEIPVGEIFEKIKDFKETQFLIIDGILTRRLITLLLPMKIKFIACKNKEEKLRIPSDITVFFF